MQPWLAFFSFFFILYDAKLVIACENILIGLAQHPAEWEPLQMFISD